MFSFLPIYVETLLIKYVIPFELIHQTKLQQKWTEEIEDRLGVRVVQHLLGIDHPLFELDCSLNIKVSPLQYKLLGITFFKFSLA